MDLRGLIASVGEMYKKRFIVNPRVMGVIDLGSVNPDLISITHSGNPGCSRIRCSALRGCRNHHSREQRAFGTLPIVDGAGHISGDDSEVVTVVIPIINGTDYTTNQMVASLRSLVADWGYINAAPDGKSVMLVDKVANARRIVALLNSQSKAR